MNKDSKYEQKFKINYITNYVGLKNLIIFLIIVLSLVLFDQLIKLEFCTTQVLFSKCILNTGSAYSMFSSIGLYSLVIAILGVLMSIILLMYNSYFIKEFGMTLTSLLMAGIISNTIDRVFIGAVRDMLSIPFIHFFGIFNVADIYLTIAGLYILYILLSSK
ncbi:MAG: signal peptidase II [Nanoarchaeota archaeon]|nr:signal peptidase II [Nanoarchaeota archaeon]